MTTRTWRHSTAANFSTSDLHQFDQLSNINLPDPPSFTVVGETGGARPSYIGIVSASESGTTVTVNTSVADGLSIGNTVVIAESGVAAYDGSYTVTGTPSPTQFTFTSTKTGLANSTGGTIGNPVSTLETTLDVEWSHAMAPGANIILIEMSGGLTGADVATRRSTRQRAWEHRSFR